MCRWGERWPLVAGVDAVEETPVGSWELAISPDWSSRTPTTTETRSGGEAGGSSSDGADGADRGMCKAREWEAARHSFVGPLNDIW